MNVHDGTLKTTCEFVCVDDYESVSFVFEADSSQLIIQPLEQSDLEDPHFAKLVFGEKGRTFWSGRTNAGHAQNDKYVLSKLLAEDKLVCPSVMAHLLEEWLRSWTKWSPVVASVQEIGYCIRIERAHLRYLDDITLWVNEMTEKVPDYIDVADYCIRDLRHLPGSSGAAEHSVLGPKALTT